MSQPQLNASPLRAESWENEGGSIALEAFAESLGIVRHPTETYSVGGFKYTNLADAISQARRMANLERALLGTLSRTPDFSSSEDTVPLQQNADGFSLEQNENPDREKADA